MSADLPPDALTVKAGDKVLICFNRDLTFEEAENVKDHLERFLPGIEAAIVSAVQSVMAVES